MKRWIVAIAAGVATCLMAGCNRGQRAEVVEMDTTVVEQPVLMYGLPVDSFMIESYKVGRGDNLTILLLRAGVTRQKAYEATQAIGEVMDVRELRQGNNYTLFYSCPNDSTRELAHIVYHKSEATYMRCSLNHPMSAIIEHREVKTKERTASGVINYSLSRTIAEQGLSPLLSNELSDVYAWTIDFFGLEKGDRFKVIYDENFIDSTSIGIGEIKAALFEHSGRKYYAFRYVQDSVASYFDLEGNSLRKEFLKAPLKFSRVSSRFSNGRMHPVLKIRRPHHGVDYAAPSGTPVMTIGDGKVIAKGWDSKGGGNYIKIRHNSVYTTVYMHLRGFAKGISNGSMVRQGDVIGYVGSTGLATGPHLDFRVYMNGKPVDPLKMEAPPAEPISNDEFEEYMVYSDSVRIRIDNG